MKPHIHKVQYYETDQMGITHHSNYIRWMEEARTDYLSRIGCDYRGVEELGLISPVISVNCKYKKSTHYSEQIAIDVKIKKFNGIRLTIEYTMINADTSEVVCTGSSEHCFLGRDSRPVHLKRDYPDIYQKLAADLP